MVKLISDTKKLTWQGQQVDNWHVQVEVRYLELLYKCKYKY